jgi:hypothetical protein
MAEQELKRKALNPLTPAGIARFAHAPLGKVLAICFIFACIAGTSVILFTARCWSPVIDEAVRALPTNSVIEAGQLFWPERIARLLAANEYLAIDVNPETAKAQAKSSDVVLVFEPYGLRIGSLFGYAFLPYPERWVVQFNRDMLAPNWGAWQPAIIAGLGIGTALALMLSWTLLALLYAFYPWFVAALFKRDLLLHQAWKLCYAAMMPGSILMSFGLLLYVFGHISVVFFLIIFAVHFVIGWLYIFLAAFCLKKAEVVAVERGNPFDTEKKARKTRSNPFASDDN